ncbi:MAG: hypothetical protein M1840_007011 [Geoglossum simile]|nr:MAG: hypothetical protein M1840_007011 [Geoglossum simile]
MSTGSNTPGASAAKDNPTSLGAKRKREPGSSRGVASLTPEQLERKRANDRDAQRAIRERTKSQIEALERQIQDLTSQKPYQELQIALREKEIVQAENEEIRKRLHSVLSIVQPILHSHSGVISDPTAGNPVLSSSTKTAGDSPQYDGSNQRTHPLHSSQEYPLSATPLDREGRIPNIIDKTSHSTDASLSPASTSSSRRMGNYSGPEAPIPRHGRYSPMSLVDQSRENMRHGLDLGASGEKLGLNFLLDGTPDGTHNAGDISRGHSKSATQSSFSSPLVNLGEVLVAPSRTSHNANFSDAPNSLNIDSPSMHGMSIPRSGSSISGMRIEAYPSGSGHYLNSPGAVAHMCPTRNTPSTCPIDSILLEFLSSRQNLAAQGEPSSVVVGPPYPSVSSLLNPEKKIKAHPLTRIFTDILGSFEMMSKLPEQVAVLYVMFLVMRWQISPTLENYDRVPDWITPRPSQLLTMHPIWVDYLPWPKMRDVLVRDYTNYVFQDFSFHYTNSLSLNWSYEPTDVLLPTPGSDELCINPVFERHLRDLKNWSLGPEFRDAYPALCVGVRIKPVDGVRLKP